MDPSERQAFQEDMEADQALAKTVEDMQSMLGSLRTLDTEEGPSDHLDSLILAQAKQTIESQEESWIQKLLGRPGLALAFSGAFALIIAVIVLPNRQTQAPVNDFSGVEVEQQREQFASKTAPDTSPPPASDTIVSSAKEEEPSQVARKKIENGRIVSKAHQAQLAQTPQAESRQDKQLRSTFAGKRKSVKKSRSIIVAPLGVKMKNERSSKVAAQDLGISISQRGVQGIRSKPEVGTLGGLDGALSSNRSNMKGSGGGAAPKVTAKGSPSQPTTTRGSSESKTRLNPSGRIKKRALTGPAPRTQRTQSRASARVSTSVSEDPAQREAWAREQARNAQKMARKFLTNGDVRAARKVYLETRTRVRGTVAFFEVSLWLAQLEYSQGRFAEARQFASEAGRSRDQSIQQKAREVVARVREDQSQLDSVPASTD